MLTADLHWFVALAELEQVTAAASQLHISQPTLSRMLQRLERQLGCQLFDRLGRRITLNPAGAVLYEHAKRALAEMSAAAAEIASLTDPKTGMIRLDFLHSFGTWLIPDLIHSYRAEAPDVQFTLFQADAESLTARVMAGETDLAVVSPRPHAPDQLGWRRITTQTLALAVPASHRFSGLESISLSEAAEEPFIAMHPDFGMRQIFNALCAGAGFVPHITFESSELATVGGLVSATLGVAVLPVQEPPLWPVGVTLIPLSDPAARRDIGLIWPRHRQETPAVRDFRTFVSEHPKR